MYPKQTKNTPNYKNEKIAAISQNEFLKKYNVDKSFLVYHNLGSKVSEYIEIEMPYMILYESLNTTNRNSVFFEFTEANKNMFYSTLDEMEHSLGTRPLHSHDFYELTFVLSGSIKLQIEDEIISYQAGECCLCNKNIHHREIFDSDFEIVLFLFKEEFLKEMLDCNILYDKAGTEYKQNTFFNRLFADNKSQHIYDAKEYIDFRLVNNYHAEVVFSHVNSIISEISSYHSGKSYMMKALLCQFISLLENKDFYEIGIHWAKLSNDEAIVFQILSLYESYQGHMSRQLLEKETGYNADYLNRVVKKRTGKTLSELGRTILLSIAADRIKSSDEKITDICEDLGYSNRCFFNKIFSQQYGMTPSKFRAQNHYCQ